MMLVKTIEGPQNTSSSSSTPLYTTPGLKTTFCPRLQFLLSLDPLMMWEECQSGSDLATRINYRGRMCVVIRDTPLRPAYHSVSLRSHKLQVLLERVVLFPRWCAGSAEYPHTPESVRIHDATVLLWVEPLADQWPFLL